MEDEDKNKLYDIDESQNNQENPSSSTDYESSDRDKKNIETQIPQDFYQIIDQELSKFQVEEKVKDDNLNEGKSKDERPEYSDTTLNRILIDLCLPKSLDEFMNSCTPTFKMYYNEIKTAIRNNFTGIFSGFFFLNSIYDIFTSVLGYAKRKSIIDDFSKDFENKLLGFLSHDNYQIKSYTYKKLENLDELLDKQNFLTEKTKCKIKSCISMHKSNQINAIIDYNPWKDKKLRNENKKKKIFKITKIKNECKIYLLK